jgi:hypothetical protein
MPWRVVSDPLPTRDAGRPAYSVGAYLAYANVERDANRRPLALDEWRDRERARDDARMRHVNANRRDDTPRREWRIRTNGRTLTRDRWRKRYRVAYLPAQYRGTLTVDGMALDASRVALLRRTLDATLPLSALLSYPRDRREYFHARDTYSTHGARIAATLSPMMFSTTHTEGR